MLKSDEILAKIALRRSEAQFMARLAKVIRENQRVLDILKDK